MKEEKKELIKPTENMLQLEEEKSRTNVLYSVIDKFNRDASHSDHFSVTDHKPFEDVDKKCLENGKISKNEINQLINDRMNNTNPSTLNTNTNPSTINTKSIFNTNPSTINTKSIFNTNPTYPTILPLNNLPTNNSLVGLVNLGNTCFMNTALQLLFNIPELIEYYFSKELINNIYYENKLGYKGEMSFLFYQLISEIKNTNEKYIRIHEFKQGFTKLTKMFGDYEEQDAYEFMMTLLDCLHEDDQIKNTTNTLLDNNNTLLDNNNNTLKDINNNNTINNNNIVNNNNIINNNNTLLDSNLKDNVILKDNKRMSIINKLFGGTFTSSLQCLECDNIKKSYEDYTSLSLSLLPMTYKRVLLFKSNEVIPIELVVDHNWSINNLNYVIHKEYLVNDLLFTSVNNGKIEKVYKKERILEINNNLFIYEYSTKKETLNNHTSFEEYVNDSNTIKESDTIKESATIKESVKKNGNGSNNNDSNNNYSKESNFTVKGLNSVSNLHGKYIWLRILTNNYFIMKRYYQYIYLYYLKDSLSLNNHIKYILRNVLLNYSDLDEVSVELSKSNRIFNTLTIIPKKNSEFINDLFVYSLTSDSVKDINLLIKLLSKKDYLLENNKCFCEVCKKLTNHSKELILYKLPNYLIIHLKRLIVLEKNGVITGIEKNNSVIKIDNIINVNGVKYKLNSIGCHYEIDKESGHYVAYVKKDDWYVINDARVDRVDIVDKDNTYVAVYSRIE